ncbi:class I SAM-dependent rRNA methyltransferase [Neolewinella lacunae]|uniref:Class I SAM-dependent rRNA methyltransferase n=1 Tax=Neolewinella lacunae TaxID=1517758 RepID=A0A923PFG4_9BACT|nr:class I SAM-dependent rRNA methyltransferase [Neolewinella lacunae]MBC6993092.1 class I SAM-dependent rRNA methyltransferase [Neolewinella lacunae]MDN3635912.1 class I SAM-dependent rRNA methyltransferase [Neolewinella lacunae]
MKKVTLLKGKDGAIRRRNPWVFSGAIRNEDEGLLDGDLVVVEDSTGERLGLGHYQNGGIRVRMLHFGAGEISIADLLRDKLAAALALRQQLGLAADPLTNAYRLVHAEGDGLPGLIVDRYASVVVLQCHSIGMYRLRQEIATALRTLLGEEVRTIYDKSAASLPERQEASDGVLLGETVTEVVVLENGRRFLVDVAGGQKTGFFLDQRENRWLLGSYAQGKSVLNAFCYTGGFSVYALLGDAAQVHSVDLSSNAIDLADGNVARNGDFTERHRSYAADVMEWLRDQADAGGYDLVIIDPPAFAKNKHKRHQAVQAYKRLNARAMQALKPGGLLFTFSCSRVVERQLFYDTVVAAGLEAGRDCRVLHHLSQGPDHPVSLYHPEGEYLKGLVLRVD